MPSGSGTLRGASTAIFNSRPRYHNLRSVLLPPFTASELKVHRGRSPCRRAFSPGKCQSQSQNSGQADLETQAVPLARAVQNLNSPSREARVTEAGNGDWRLRQEGRGESRWGEVPVKQPRSALTALLAQRRGMWKVSSVGSWPLDTQPHPHLGGGPPCSPCSLEEKSSEKSSHGSRGPCAEVCPHRASDRDSCCPPQARHSSHPVADRTEGRCSPYSGWTCYYGISQCTQTRKNRTMNVSLP